MFDHTEIDRVIEKHDTAIESASKHPSFVRTKVRDELPWLNEETNEIRTEIARVRRSRSTVKVNSNKYSRLSDRLKELNSRFRRVTREAIRKFMESTHRVESVQQFWAKWKRTKFRFNDHIPIFESNQSRTIEENIDIRSKELLWFLSNHGPHRAYLKRFGLAEEESCRLCKTLSTETIEHLLRDCEATATWLPADKDDVEACSEAIERTVCELRKCERQEPEEL